MLIVFSLENGSHFPGFFWGVGVCQVILDYILDILNIMLCLLWTLLYNLLDNIELLVLLNRQSLWLGSDCKFCLPSVGGDSSVSSISKAFALLLRLCPAYVPLSGSPSEMAAV